MAFKGSGMPLKKSKRSTISVSNFNTDQLDCIREAGSDGSRTYPSVNQMRYSAGAGGNSVIKDDARYGIVVQAWSPLQRGYLASSSLLQSIGKMYGKTAAQVGY